MSYLILNHATAKLLIPLNNCEYIVVKMLNSCRLGDITQTKCRYKTFNEECDICFKLINNKRNYLNNYIKGI